MRWDVVTESELARVRAMDEDDLSEWYDGDNGRRSFDVDKAWHGVHAVLTGTAWDTDGLGQVVLGGEPFGPDLGYGPPRTLRAGDVAAVASAMEALPVERFRTRIDLDELTRLDIYPAIWDEGDDAVDYLVHGYATIRSRFREAADAGLCFVVSCL